MTTWVIGGSEVLFAVTAGSLLQGWTGVGLIVLAVFAALLLFSWLTLRFIPNDRVGIVEKLWSAAGSVPEGRIVALGREAGYQAELLRGGIHFGYWRWQYRIHKSRLVTIAQGKIGYVYARDGAPLSSGQTLGRIVDCNYFQDARRFLAGNGSGNDSHGQRGRQRAILREGVYAINAATFIVITEARVHALRHLMDPQEVQIVAKWREDLLEIDGFEPVIVGRPLPTPHPLDPDSVEEVDSIGIVTVHDGPSLAPGEIIAPAVGTDPADENYHNNYQDPEAMLRAGGRRGRQYLPLTDGTYFINRWFAAVELIPKTVVPIGYVGVVVSYYGRQGTDVSGDAFRHGERVAEGERGVWERPLGPGKYPFNTFAGSIVLVPTTNFVLHWITGKSESHRYDESLRSIDLVTKDAYEPLLPLSVVVHIDYQRAPSVIQRFGDVKRLITQTLDPMLSAFFRDVAHKKTMLALLHERDEIQAEAREVLRKRFREFDIECVDVLIGKPDSEKGDLKIETLLEQLRQRQLSFEQLETYERQRAAADKLRILNESQAQANMQTELTNARVQIQISESHGEADLARARKQAEQVVVVSDGELSRSRRQAEQTIVLAEADARQRELAGRGEAQRIAHVGLSEAAVLFQRIASYRDPRLYAMSLLAEQLSKSTQPLVPERVFVAGGDGASAAPSGQATGLLGLLISLLVAEKSGFQSEANDPATVEFKDFAARMTKQVIESVQSGTKDQQ
ncbi:MAG TPA: SPFH domain-containing protein [Pirellulales bacterium]|jgi:uncharacterized membrane protein YqiK